MFLTANILQPIELLHATNLKIFGLGYKYDAIKENH